METKMIIYCLVCFWLIGWLFTVDKFDTKHPEAETNKAIFIYVVAFFTWPVITAFIIFRFMKEFKL